MKIFIFALLLSTSVAIPVIRTADSSVPSSSDVQYNCVFENQWTKDRHPKEYPLDAVHWTRQVLASHSSNYNMWKEGSLASDAVKIIAEAGGTAGIVREVEKDQGSYEIGYDKYLGSDQTMRFNNPLPMSSDKRYISVITKMAPSPDWFSGFHDFSAVNEDKQTWYKNFVIETYPYDAGVEDGIVYDNFNGSTKPQQPVTQFMVNNVPNGIYLNTAGNDILPVAKYTCTLNTYSSSNIDIEKINSFVPSSQSVEYSCVFENQWNKERHPWEFPQDFLSFHWTKQVLASHNSGYSMWKEGSVASKGVGKLAESGVIGDIIQELQDLGDSYNVGYDKYLYTQDPKVIYEPLRMNSNKRYISAISKLSPSPDWFSGFHDFNAVNEESGTWYQEFSIPVYPFDAGTENGETYDNVNSRTVPAQPISQFTLDNLPGNEIFLNGEGDAILPVATYTCTLFAFGDNMRPTQSPIFAPLTHLPTEYGFQQSDNDMSAATIQTNNAGLIVGTTIGIITVVFSVAALVYMIFYHQGKNSKDTVEEASTSSSEDEEDQIDINNHEFA